MDPNIDNTFERDLWARWKLVVKNNSTNSKIIMLKRKRKLNFKIINEHSIKLVIVSV
jgi:hypothetical protein